VPASSVSNVTGYRCLVPVGAVDLHVHMFGRSAAAYVTAVMSACTARRWLAVSPDLPVLVVLHGGPGGDHRALVPPLAPLAGAGCHLLFVDLRGHGLSGRPAAADCTLAQMADDLTAMRTALEIEPARLNLLGVSFGAGVALTFADRHPGQCARLLLSSAVTSFRADADWVEQVRLRGTPEQALAAAAIVSGTLPTLTALRNAQRLVRPLYYADSARLPASATADACADEAVLPENLELVNWWYCEGSLAYCAESYLTGLRVPTLILAGSADPLATPAQARALATAIPGAQLHVFERSGHLPQVEEPAAYRAAISAFLRLGGDREVFPE
jgi:proline iminopeptidase